MELFLLLLAPLLIALGGFLWSAFMNDRRYLISMKEFLALLGVVVAVITLGYAISRITSTWDEEVWNGRVVSKKKERTSCSHAYPCNPHPCMCDDDGCSTCWDTCYQHANDWNWKLYTSNEEQIHIKRIDSQGTKEPPRFTQAQVGDPTALTHPYSNYIKANPWSILRREGAIEKFKDIIPSYPLKVYDYHFVDRFLAPAGKISQDVSARWSRDLMDLNADLGKRKKVNVIFVVAPTADSRYLHALEEAWLGGKQNDLVVIVGVTQYPRIEWVRVMSWTRVEELKIALRDSLQEIGSLEKRPEIIAKTRELTEGLFVKTKMKEFEYLIAGVRPSTGALITLFVLGFGLSVGLSVYFWRNDPFETGRKCW